MKGRCHPAALHPEISAMDEQTELLTAHELAERLRVSPETIRGWARHGLIPTLRLSPKVIRFDPQAVVAALTKRSKKGVDLV